MAKRNLPDFNTSAAVDAAANSNGCPRAAEQGGRRHLSNGGNVCPAPAPAALAMAEGREETWFGYLSQALPAGQVRAEPFSALPEVNLFCALQKQVRVK